MIKLLILLLLSVQSPAFIPVYANASVVNISNEEAKNEVSILTVQSQNVTEDKAEQQEEDEYELYELTAYSNHFASTGKRKGDKGYGITASGAKTKEGVTIAADWKVLPKGTKVWIEGVGERVVQDKGSAIKNKRIDVYFEKEKDALEFGRKKNVKVRIIN